MGPLLCRINRNPCFCPASRRTSSDVSAYITSVFSFLLIERFLNNVEYTQRYTRGAGYCVLRCIYITGPREWTPVLLLWRLKTDKQNSLTLFTFLLCSSTLPKQHSPLLYTPLPVPEQRRSTDLLCYFIMSSACNVCLFAIVILVYGLISCHSVKQIRTTGSHYRLHSIFGEGCPRSQSTRCTWALHLIANDFTCLYV